MNIDYLFWVIGLMIVLPVVGGGVVRLQIRRLQKRGLYPKGGDCLTQDHIDVLIRNGELAFAARLTRRLYGVSIKRAVDMVEKMKIGMGPQANRYDPKT